MVTRNCFPYILILGFIFSVSSETQQYRLSKNVIPKHYDLQILSHLGDKSNFTFSGQVDIQLYVSKETKAITLMSKNLIIKENDIKLTCLDEPEKKFAVQNVTYDIPVDFLNIAFDKGLTSDHTYQLSIPFEGVLSESLVGYYRSSYKNHQTGKNEWIAVTQFEPTYARRAFPCFDEPDMKATFSITLGRKEGLKAISNMPLTKSVPIDGSPGWYWDKFEKSVPMSTYLVAYIVSQLDHLDSPKNSSSAQFKIWARKDAINQTAYASEVGPKVLNFYEKFFDVTYPLPKQDMVAIPDFSAGAMENWGLITYRETALLYSPEITSTSNKFYVASVIAHELAHQWFGNLVTMKWWTDLWLNEGFATYIATLGVANIHPEWNSLTQESVSNLQDVFELDSLNTSHPVSVPIGHPSEINQIFDAISYKKGSALLRMMNTFLGETAFRKGLTNYLNKYKYSNAEQDDLWECLTEAGHETKSLANDMTVKQVMDSWTTQTGYPLITVSRNYDNKSITISQSRFLKSKPTAISLNSQWWIPLTIAGPAEINLKSGGKPDTWIKGQVMDEIKVTQEAHEWLLLNIDLSAVCRVNYDDTNWKMLIKALKSPNSGGISQLNKFQLITDSMDFAWSNIVDYKLSLSLLQYLVNENDYIPWSSALSSLNDISKQLKRTSSYGVFKSYMKQLLNDTYLKIGGLHSKVVATPDKLDAVKQQVLISNWACKMGVQDCRKNAIDLFSEWMLQKNPDQINSIPKDLHGIVYCIGVENGDEKEFDFVWQRYLKAQDPNEKVTLLYSLGCSENVWLLQKLLEMSITDGSGIRRQDAKNVFSRVGSSQVGYYIAKAFLYEHGHDIANYDTPNTMGAYAKTIAGQIMTTHEADEFVDWTKANAAILKDANILVKQSLESITINLDWQNTHLVTVTSVLQGLLDQ